MPVVESVYNVFSTFFNVFLMLIMNVFAHYVKSDSVSSPNSVFTQFNNLNKEHRITNKDNKGCIGFFKSIADIISKFYLLLMSMTNLIQITKHYVILLHNYARIYMCQVCKIILMYRSINASHYIGFQQANFLFKSSENNLLTVLHNVIELLNKTVKFISIRIIMQLTVLISILCFVNSVLYNIVNDILCIELILFCVIVVCSFLAMIITSLSY